jgi:hypothetical protein
MSTKLLLLLDEACARNRATVYQPLFGLNGVRKNNYFLSLLSRSLVLDVFQCYVPVTCRIYMSRRIGYTQLMISNVVFFFSFIHVILYNETLFQHVF